MYSHTYEEMEEASVTFKLETPVWIDENGNQCAKKHTSACTVTHSLAYQDICFVMDKVGGSTSQKGNGHIRGRFIVCGKGMVPKNKINAKEKEKNGRSLDSPHSTATSLCASSSLLESANK